MLASEWTPNTLEVLANYAQLIGIVGLVAAAWAVRHSWMQIKQGSRAARGQFILALDDALAQHSVARKRVNTKDWTGPDGPAERNEIRRYLAVFERIGILVQDKLLTIETVNQLYGDRLVKLLSHDEVRKLVDGREYEQAKFSSPEAWRDLIWLARELDKTRQHSTDKRLLPEAPESGPRRTSGAAPDIDQYLEREALEQAPLQGSA